MLTSGNHMLNKRFCLIATTGRTASHFLCDLFIKFGDPSEVALFHDYLFTRLKPRKGKGKCLENYLVNLMKEKPGRTVYVECNGAFLEWVALRYKVPKASDVIGPELLTVPVKSILLVRHPYGYVKSLKAQGWMWDWQKMDGFSAVHCGKSRWNELDKLGKYALAWQLKNNFFYDMIDSDDGMLVKFENLFAHGDKRFVSNVRGIANYLGFELRATDKQLAVMRNKRVAPKAGGSVRLTPGEKRIVKGLCKPMMQKLGYK